MYMKEPFNYKEYLNSGLLKESSTKHFDISLMKNKANTDSDKITVKEILDFTMSDKNKFVYAYNKQKDKSLILSYNGTYEVWHNKKGEIMTDVLSNAVKEYNSL